MFRILMTLVAVIVAIKDTQSLLPINCPQQFQFAQQFSYTAHVNKLWQKLYEEKSILRIKQSLK